MAKNASSKAKSELVPRTPIVAVMGHVDHGKTSLLDAIRGSRVAAKEVGGITQNTRAHKVSTEEYLGGDADYNNITFIDTPGHEAFPEMRSRGARVADIAMLVVAADDGVQPQTKESIEFIKKSGIPVVVACNKVDTPGSNPDKVKQELSQHEILVEEYGGEAVFVEVSAVEGTGLKDLVESIALLAEVNELQEEKPVQGVAEGFVLESNLDKNLGAVNLIILKSGSTLAGNYGFTGDSVERIRATLDEEQKRTEKAVQGDPVWIIGFSEVLEVGENVIFFDSESDAESLMEIVSSSDDKDPAVSSGEIADSDIFAKLLGEQEERQDTETTLNVVLRADSQGTLEAITSKLEKLKFEEAKVNVFQAQTGDVSESDVETANNISGVVLAFQVGVEDKAMELARRDKVLVRSYQLIYEMLNEIEEVVNSMVEPEEEIEDVATAEVKQVFTLSDGTIVAGCKVTEGTVVKGYKAYVERGDEETHDGRITSLKHLKDDVKEAKKGTECGIILEPNPDVESLQEGDIIICYKVVK